MVEISSDGSLMALTSRVKVEIWDARMGELQRTLALDIEIDCMRIESVAFSSEDLLVTAFSFNQVSIITWNVDSGMRQWTFEGRGEWDYLLAFSADSRLLAKMDRYSCVTIELWDAKTRALQRKLEDHTGNINEVTCSGDGRLVASASRGQESTIKLWNATTGELQRTFDSPTGPI